MNVAGVHSNSHQRKVMIFSMEETESRVTQQPQTSEPLSHLETGDRQGYYIAEI